MSGLEIMVLAFLITSTFCAFLLAEIWRNLKYIEEGNLIVIGNTSYRAFKVSTPKEKK